MAIPVAWKQSWNHPAFRDDCTDEFCCKEIKLLRTTEHLDGCFFFQSRLLLPPEFIPGIKLLNKAMASESQNIASKPGLIVAYCNKPVKAQIKNAFNSTHLYFILSLGRLFETEKVSSVWNRILSRPLYYFNEGFVFLTREELK